MQTGLEDYLSESGHAFISEVAAFLQNPDPSRVDDYLRLIPTPKKNIYSDGIRAIYEPSFEEPLTSSLLVLGEAGLEILYRMFLGIGYPSVSIHSAEVLFSVGRQYGGSVFEHLEFMRRYVDEAVIDSTARKIESVYDNPELALKARELIARAVQHAIASPQDRALLGPLVFLAEGEDFNLLMEAIARNTLSISDEVCDTFQELVDQDLTENIYQDFLRQYPALIDPMASEIVDRQELANEWKTDFVIRRLDNEYIFVEIEKPRDRPFTKYPSPSSQLSHALGQVLNWFIWIEDNISYAHSHGFPDVHAPKGVVVIGRARDLSATQARMLRALNDTLNPRVTVLTFDDLLVNARNVVANLLARQSC